MILLGNKKTKTKKTNKKQEIKKGSTPITAGVWQQRTDVTAIKVQVVRS